MNNKFDAIGALLSFIVGLIVGVMSIMFMFAVPLSDTLDDIKTQAVNVGYAYYHPMTKEFTWKLPPEVNIEQ